MHLTQQSNDFKVTWGWSIACRLLEVGTSKRSMVSLAIAEPQAAAIYSDVSKVIIIIVCDIRINSRSVNMVSISLISDMLRALE